MLASYPASILNHIPPRSGIPFDSFKTGNALVSGLRRGDLVEAVYYPNAYHSFDSKVADRNVPGAAGKQHHLAYDTVAAPDAEARTKAFFAKYLR